MSVCLSIIFSRSNRSNYHLVALCITLRLCHYHHYLSITQSLYHSISCFIALSNALSFCRSICHSVVLSLYLSSCLSVVLLPHLQLCLQVLLLAVEFNGTCNHCSLMMLLENAPLFYYHAIQPSIYHHLSVLSIILSIYCSVTLSIFCSINHFVVNQSTWCRCHFVALLLFYLSFCLSLRLLLCQCIILFLICYSSYHSVALLLYCSITLSTALFFFFLSIY